MNPEVAIPTQRQCGSCRSINLRGFIAEMGIRSGGLKNIDEQSVFIFPKLNLCMDCGSAEFVVPEGELRQLAKDDTAAAG